MHTLEGDDILLAASSGHTEKSLPKDRTARDAHSAEPFLRDPKQNNSLVTRPLCMLADGEDRRCTTAQARYLLAGSCLPRGSELSHVEKEKKKRFECPAWKESIARKSSCDL
jgi:hypothetical protein